MWKCLMAFTKSWCPNYEDWEKLWSSEDENQAFCEAYLLNKANGKELDPKYFDQEEKEKFREADRKEWMSWIENKVVRLGGQASDLQGPSSYCEGQQRSFGWHLTCQVKDGHSWPLGPSPWRI